MGVIFGLVFGLLIHNIGDRCLNAKSVFPWSLISLAMAIVALFVSWFLMGYWTHDQVFRAGIAVFIGFTFLGLTSFVVTCRLFRLTLGGVQDWAGVVMCVPFAVVAWVQVVYLPQTKLGHWLAAGCFLTNTLVFIGLLYCIRPAWLSHLLGSRKKKVVSY